MKIPRYYVYEHWRPDKDVCFYVGKGIRNRANDLKTGRNPYHLKIQAKLARLGMCVEVRLAAEALTNEESLAFEVERIAFWKGMGVKLANLTLGGEGTKGLKRSKEWCEALGNRMRGRRHTAETIAKMSVASRGRVTSAETKQKQSEGVRATWTPERRAAWAIAKSGKKHSLESRQKMSGVHSTPEARARNASHGEAIRLARWTPEKRAEQAVRMRGNVPSDATREKMRNRIVTAETRARMSAVSKARLADPIARERQGSYNKGRKQPLEEVERRAAGIKAAWDRRKAENPDAGKISDEQKAAISAALTGRKQSEETKRKRVASIRATRERNRQKLTAGE